MWAPPTLGSGRSRVFSEEIGLRPPEYVYTNIDRSRLTAPLRYAIQAVKTLKLLLRKKPRVVFVQSPPSVAVWCVSLYCALTGGQYLIDAHSLALQSTRWTRPAWLHRLTIRSAAGRDRYRRLLLLADRSLGRARHLS